MPLFTKCILSKSSPSDGVRISVMSRHTFSDGKTPDPRLVGTWEERNVPLAPNPKLVGAYYRQELDWDQFAVRYVDQLNEVPSTSAVDELVARAMKETVTVMCIEETPERYHRRLLAEECKRRFPDLTVVIN
jgi:uncharacterized protein YeaO (DUF488 family)